MSLLTPERVPVKVYKWDDAGAPALDKTAGCVATIFKACLAVGYGTKEPAGWTMPFEDTVAGIKVLRPEVGPHTDFYLRLSADTGIEMAAQVYLNMSAADTGDLKLQCDTPFKYAQKNSTGKWLMLSTSRSFWFFCEQSNSGSADKTGSFLFCGDIISATNTIRPVYLQHTGGTFGNALLSNIYGVYGNSDTIRKDSGAYNYGRMMHGLNNIVTTTDIKTTGNGASIITTADHVAPVYIISDLSLYFLPGIMTPLGGAKYANFDIKNIFIGTASSDAIVFSTGPHGNSNAFFALTEWAY